MRQAYLHAQRMSTPTRTSRKAFAFEAGSEDHGKGRLLTFEERLFIGTGIGLRYSTRVGPLRLDVGVPARPPLGCR
jgi:hypothetical protein